MHQWDGSWLQAGRRGSGVHVVKETVYLPQRNSSSFVTDLETDAGRVKDNKNTETKSSCVTMRRSIYLYRQILFTQSDSRLHWRQPLLTVFMKLHCRSHGVLQTATTSINWAYEGRGVFTENPAKSLYLKRTALLTLKSSNNMWNRCEGTYTTWMGFFGAFTGKQKERKSL